MTIPTYANFDLLIDRGPTGLRSRVLRSLAGDASGTFVLPFEEGELANFLWRTVGVTRNLTLVQREQQPPPMDIRDFGGRLYRAVFAADVGTCLVRSLDEARRRGIGLRIRLRFDPGAAELADLPWEYLYAGDELRFLALSDATPVVRYLELGRVAPPLAVSPPLTVLVVLSDPRDVVRLNVEREWKLLQEAMKGLTLIRVELLPAATLEALQARLRKGPVHVLHFVGHGFFDAAQNLGGMVFEDAQGRADKVPATSLRVLLADHQALRLVFLNACQGATSGRSDSFAGVAQSLGQGGVPAVLAMQFPVSDDAAIALSHEFYRALADGYPAEGALSEARKAIATRGNAQEWATPVLFSRSDDNRLIEPPRGDRRPVIDTKLFEPETIFIPGGPFLMGNADPAASKWEQPQHEVPLPDFRIGKYPVKMGEYAEFIKDQRSQAAPPDWFNREPPYKRGDHQRPVTEKQPVTEEHPITDVSWFDALAYCAWLSGKTGRRYTLPSEAEWEKAASWGPGDKETGGQGDKRKRAYPWGPAWIEGLCTVASSGTTAVNAHPDGASSYGVEDLLGNVQEWTRSLWGSQPAQPDYGYPYDPADGREVADPAKLPAQARLVHRGGSYKSQPADLRCTARGNTTPDTRIAWRGFRVVLHLEEQA